MFRPIAIDGSGNKWIGTDGGGLVKFDDTSWTVYNTSNSGLPDNYIHSIAIDGSGNKWIGTHGGLTEFNEGGVVSVEENPTIKEIISNEYLLSQNYPNPFNPSTTIKYEIPPRTSEFHSAENLVSLKVYDILGREVATLVNENQKPGNYEIEWNAANLPSGVYFYQIECWRIYRNQKTHSIEVTILKARQSLVCLINIFRGGYYEKVFIHFDFLFCYNIKCFIARNFNKHYFF